MTEFTQSHKERKSYTNSKVQKFTQNQLCRPADHQQRGSPYHIFPNKYELDLCGTPNPSKAGSIWYSFMIILPIMERSTLWKFIANVSMISGDRDLDLRFFSFDRERSRFYRRRSERDRERFTRFYGFWVEVFLSSGLQPTQPQILQPVVESLVLRTSSGTWQMQDLPDLEKAFMQLLQHPFLASNLSSFFLVSFSFFLSSGWYSGSSPLEIKSSLEHPTHPQVWHPSQPISVLLWSLGTTHTQAFLSLSRSACLHFLQQYL